jgi:outer membrane protein
MRFSKDLLSPFVAIAAAALCAPGVAEEASVTKEEPLWEAGLGVGALSFPDYRGSDERQLYPVPVPYFVYRGEFLKSDRDGVRGEFFNREFVELSASVSATIPVQSEDNAARRGLPDLSPTLELGPSLELHLWRPADRDLKLDLVLPVRAPVTLESSPQFTGWVFAPRINLDVENIGGEDGWNFGVGVGPLFADDRYHEYFYNVAPEFATTERPAYDAGGGYSGAHLLSAVSKRFPRYWVGAYVRYDVLSGAAFEDSPLVRQKSYIAGGFGIAWIIGQSKRMVKAED